MKKNILKVTLVAAIAMACGISFLNSQKSEALSDIALANVEALASDGESSGIPWQGFLYNWKAGCCERHNPYAECSGAYTAC